MSIRLLVHLFVHPSVHVDQVEKFKNAHFRRCSCDYVCGVDEGMDGSYYSTQKAAGAMKLDGVAAGAIFMLGMAADEM